MNEKKPTEAELQEHIQQTRQQLGETVEALAHKMDVPGRVKEQVHETTDRVKTQVQDTAEKAKAQAEKAKLQAQDTVHRMTVATDHAVGSLPDPVAEQVNSVRRHPAALAAVLAAILLVLWGLSRRNR